jgi:hypothetical protein
MALTIFFSRNGELRHPFRRAVLLQKATFTQLVALMATIASVCSASSASLNWTCAAAKLGSDEGQWLNDGALGSVVSRTFRTL